ncbi:MAG: DoxX family protein [Candidatus Scalinduaceae bacterium]
MVFSCLDKYRDVGLLILRVGIGLMFMGHGCPKLFGGPEKWELIGGITKFFGLDFVPTFWGFMAAVSEFFGGAFIALGFLTRPACFLLFITMIFAASMHIGKGDSFIKYSHAVEAGILFLSMLFIGPGKYSLDEQIFSRKKTSHSNTISEKCIQ